MACGYISFTIFHSTVTSFPDGHFSMSALDCLEKVAGISIINKLAKMFLDNKLTSELPFNEQIFGLFKNNPVEGSKIMLNRWVSTNGHPPPTWQELLNLFRDNQMGEVAQEIEDYFNKVSATSPSVSLVSSVHVYTSSWYSDLPLMLHAELIVCLLDI